MRRQISRRVAAGGAQRRTVPTIRLRRHLETLRLLLETGVRDDRRYVDYLMLSAQQRLAWARERDRHH